MTLFDDMAKSFKEELLKRGAGTKIIILTSVKVGKFQGIIIIVIYIIHFQIFLNTSEYLQQT